MIRYHSTARDWWWNSHPASPERSCRAIRQMLQTLKPWRDQVLSVSHQTPSTTINNHEQQKTSISHSMAKMKHPKVKINATGYPFITSQFGLIQSLPPPKQNLMCLICGNTVGWGVSQKMDGTQVTVALASPFPVIIYIYITTIIDNNSNYFYCSYSWYIIISSTISILLIIIDHYWS